MYCVKSTPGPCAALSPRPGFGGNCEEEEDEEDEESDFGELEEDEDEDEDEEAAEEEA